MCQSKLFQMTKIIAADDRSAEYHLVNNDYKFRESICRFIVDTVLMKRSRKDTFIIAGYQSMRLIDVSARSNHKITFKQWIKDYNDVNDLVLLFKDKNCSNEFLTPNIIEIVKSYRLYVLSPLDYIYMLRTTLETDDYNDKACKILCLCILLDSGMYQHHPSVIAVSCINLVRIININYQDPGLHINATQISELGMDHDEIKVCMNLIVKCTKRAMSFIAFNSYCSRVHEEPTSDISTFRAVDTLKFIDKGKYVGDKISVLSKPQFSIESASNGDVAPPDLDMLITGLKNDRASIIGRGSFSTVHKLIYQDKDYAVKIFNENFAEDGPLGDFVNEYAILTNLNGVYNKNFISLPIYYDKEGKYLVFERGISDLSFCCDMNTKVIMSYVYQLLRAVEICHNRMIAHRDIKPKNIIVYEGGRLRLVDFGNAGLHNCCNPNINNEFTTYIYAPPEHFEKKSIINPLKTDIWSLGCVIYELFTDNILIDTDQNIFDNIGEAVINTALSIKNNGIDKSSLGASTTDFLEYILQYDIDKRPTIADILSHPFSEKCRECFSELVN